jgi:hypothetical protein
VYPCHCPLLHLHHLPLLSEREHIFCVFNCLCIAKNANSIDDDKILVFIQIFDKTFSENHGVQKLLILP